MKPIYVRIDDRNHAYIAELATNAGLSVARIVDALLTDARHSGKTVSKPLSATVVTSAK